MSDFERRMKDLDGIDPGDHPWEPDREPREGPLPREHGVRRAVTITTAFVVFAAAAAIWLIPTERDDPRTAPASASSDEPAEVLRIECSEQGAALSATSVIVQPSGPEIQLASTLPEAMVSIRAAGDATPLLYTGVGEGHRLDGHGSLGPGAYEAACIDALDDDDGVTTEELEAAFAEAMFVPFTIVDPDGNWSSVADRSSCGDPLPAPGPGVGSPGSIEPTGLVTVGTFDGWRDETFRLSFPSGTSLGLSEVVAEADGAVLSPDGRSYALEIQDDADGDPTTTTSREDSEIWTSAADGSGLTKITDNTEAADYLVRWRPDGTGLSFVSNREGPITIYTMDVDGSSVHRLLPDGWDADSHAWSPDGRSVAFVGAPPEPQDDGCFRTGSRHLYVLDTSTGEITRLTDEEWYVQAPEWSPDGTRIAFKASEQSDYAWEIFVIGADGSELVRLTDYEGYDSAPTWSPDGELIAFSSDRDRGPNNGEGQAGRLYVMRADGSSVTELLTATALGLPRDAALWIGDWRSDP